MPSTALYALTAFADLLIAVGTALKLAQAAAYGKRLDAALWTLFTVGVMILAIAYGLRAVAAI